MSVRSRDGERPCAGLKAGGGHGKRLSLERVAAALPLVEDALRIVLRPLVRYRSEDIRLAIHRCSRAVKLVRAVAQRYARETTGRSRRRCGAVVVVGLTDSFRSLGAHGAEADSSLC